MIFRIEPDGFGGFYCWRDYGAEAASDLLSVVFLVAMGAIFLWAVLVNPAIFAASMVSFFLGLLLIFFCNGFGTLYFLRPLSFPFFYYAILSASWGVTSNAGSFGLVVWAIDGLFVIGASVFLYTMVFEEMDNFCTIFFTLILGGIAWFTALSNAVSKKGGDSPTAYYSMRIVTIIALVWALVSAINFIINTFKKKVDYLSIILTGIAAVVGFVALFVVRGIAAMFNHGVMAFVGIVVMFLFIAAISSAISILAKKVNAKASGIEDGLMIPVMLLVVLYLSTLAVPNSRAELIEAVYEVLWAFPSSFSVSLAEGIGALFGTTNELLLNGLLKLIFRLFDQSSKYVNVAMLINQVTALILTFLAIVAGPAFLEKLKWKKARKV